MGPRLHVTAGSGVGRQGRALLASFQLPWSHECAFKCSPLPFVVCKILLIVGPAGFADERLYRGVPPALSTVPVASSQAASVPNGGQPPRIASRHRRIAAIHGCSSGLMRAVCPANRHRDAATAICKWVPRRVHTRARIPSCCVASKPSTFPPCVARPEGPGALCRAEACV